jgi:hypothetical protein
MISGNGVMTDDAPARPDYAYNASLVGAPTEFYLRDDALEWRRGDSKGRAAYSKIRRLRLSFRPMTMQSYRFLAEIWPDQGPKVQIASTSWKSMFEQERLDAAYRTFVAELSRRIAAAGSRTQFETGSPAFLYWPGVAVLGVASLSIIALAFRALQTGALAGAAFILAFVALFLWQGGNFFRRNRPGAYDARHIPERVLPKA